MRIIKKNKLHDFFREHRQGTAPLLRWYEVAKKAHWKKFADVRETFPSADAVPVESGRTAVVFNIKQNDYRLITAVHYERTVRDGSAERLLKGKIFLFFFLTHAEYDKQIWKSVL